MAQLKFAKAAPAYLLEHAERMGKVVTVAPVGSRVPGGGSFSSVSLPIFAWSVCTSKAGVSSVGATAGALVERASCFGPNALIKARARSQAFSFAAE